MSAITDLAARTAEAAGIALVLLDGEGVVTYVNPAAETLFDRSARRMLGLPIAQFGTLGEQAAQLGMRAINESREVLAHDVQILDDISHMRVAIDVVPDRDGACVSIRRWPESGESPRGDTAANAAAGFGRMLAHELKNPMAGARGAAQLLEQASAEEIADLSAIIIRELDRAKRIADRWSSIGDLAPNPPQPTNLHVLVREAMQSASKVGHSSLIWREIYDPSLPFASADRDLVFQAVLNLLINAAEAVEPDGEIEVSTRYRSAPPGGPAPAARLEVRIEDNGPGVPAHLFDAIFNPFVTGKPAGEGLGLAFVSRVADLHGGGVEFESRPGRTVFRLYLMEDRA